MVTNSRITGVEDGTAIYISGGSPTLSGNTITDNQWSTGISISSGSPTLTGNAITYNDTGVDISGGSVTLSGNTIANNDYNGVYIYDTSPTLTGNTITDNSNGIYVWNGTPLINNNMLSCNTGTDLVNSTTGTINAQNNQWDHAPPTDGNLQGYCNNGGEDICSPNGGSINYTGNTLAPSPCP